MLRMDECNKIYKDFHIHGLTKNQIANKFNRAWATIDKIVGLSPEQIANRSSKRNRKPIVLTDEVTLAINALLDQEEELKVPRKQRYRPGFLFHYLVDRGIYQGSLRTLRRHMANIRAERKQKKQKVFVQLEFEFGEYLQVDHGPTTLNLDGQKMAGHLFVATVPGASLRYCQFYPTKAQEAWGDFHDRVFKFFQGIFPRVIYDNDSVLKVPKSGEPTQFCLELQHYYGFEAIFCNKASGWEKGSVENAVGFCRRNYLAGLPQFNNLTEVNRYLAERCHGQISSGHHYENKRPLKELKNSLLAKLWPCKNEKSWSVIREARVNSQQLVRYRGHRYSVPEKFVGSLLQLSVSAFEVVIVNKSEVLARHQRKFHSGEDSIELDHYLDQLARKPRAFDYAKVVKQTNFDGPLANIRDRLNFKLDQSLATKDFIKILQLKRECNEQEYEVALELALETGAITYGGVRSILRQLQAEINQTIEEIDCDHIKIDHHFNLNKYSELERRNCYD